MKVVEVSWSTTVFLLGSVGEVKRPGIAFSLTFLGNQVVTLRCCKY